LHTGLEKKSNESIAFCIRNLKQGIVNVSEMTYEKMVYCNGHDVPPIEAVNLNHLFLDIFEAEAFKRGMNPDEIGPDIGDLHQVWLDNRE
jgi:hypothetical protein